MSLEIPQQNLGRCTRCGRHCFPGGLPFRPSLNKKIVLTGLVNPQVLVQKQDVKKGLGPLSFRLALASQEPLFEIGNPNDDIGHRRSRNGDIEGPTEFQKEESSKLDRHVLENEVDPVVSLRRAGELDPQFVDGLGGFFSRFFVDVGGKLDDVGHFSGSGIDDVPGLGIPSLAVFGKTRIGGRRKQEIPGTVQRGTLGSVVGFVAHAFRRLRCWIDLGKFLNALENRIGGFADPF